MKQVFFLSCLFSFHCVLSQDESSPLLKEREKESQLKKIKTCTGDYFGYDTNGILLSQGARYFFETYDHRGNITGSVNYLLNGDVAEKNQFKYDSAGRVVMEQKIVSGIPAQKHIYHYAQNGNRESGEVYMDTSLVHTCYYMYDSKNRISQIIIRHKISVEKNVPEEEGITYVYDEKGNVVKEFDDELEPDGKRLRVRRNIYTTEYFYNKDFLIIQMIRYEGKNCIGKTEFHYNPGKEITEEVNFNSCSGNPNHVIKYSYEQY